MLIERRIPFFLLERHIRRGNKWTLAFVMLLMSVAFVNLVFINSLFNGITETANKQVIETTAANVTVAPVAGQEYLDNAAATIAKIQKVPGVVSASSRVIVPVTSKYKNVVGFFQTLAVDPAREKRTTITSRKMIKGGYLSEHGTDEIIIGRQVAGGKGVETSVASFNGAGPGGTVTLSMGDVSKQFKIKGVFYTKYFQADQTAYISQAALDSMAPAFHDRATSIIVKTKKRGDEQLIIKRLEAAGVRGKFTIWLDATGQMKSVTSSFVSINALLTTVGFIIAAVVIFIIIYVDITNRRRQIGILRAIGIKSTIVSSVYILQSTVYALVGVLFGSLIYFAVLIPYFKVHPFSIPLGDVNLFVNVGDFVWRAVAVIAVSILSGLIPALLAARGNILDEISGR